MATAVLMGGGPALAEPPFDVPGQITDRAGALGSGDESRIQEALDRLQSEEGVQLFVVYVDSFDGTPPTDWADATAEQSGFGGNYVLFAVAVQDRRYGVSVDQIPISDSELDDLLASDVEAELGDDDWAGAAVALADGLGGGGGGNTALWVVGGVAVVGGGAYLVARSRRKSRESAADGAVQGPV